VGFYFLLFGFILQVVSHFNEKNGKLFLKIKKRRLNLCYWNRVTCKLRNICLIMHQTIFTF